MGNLTPAPSRGTPATLPLPVVPERIAAHLRAKAAHARDRAAWQAATPEEREGLFVGQPPQPPRLSPGEVEIARQAEAQLAASLAPVTLPQLLAWLAPVNSAVRNPQSPADLMARAAGLWEVLNDLPGGAFTSEARRDLPAFFPSAADIRMAVSAGANRLRDLADAMAAAQRPPPEAPPAPAARGPRTAEEIAHAAEAVRTIKAEIAAREAEREAARRPNTPPATARPLSDGQLAATLRGIVAAGGVCAGASALRLAVLEKRLAGSKEATP